MLEEGYLLHSASSSSSPSSEPGSRPRPVAGPQRLQCPALPSPGRVQVALPQRGQRSGGTGSAVPEAENSGRFASPSPPFVPPGVFASPLASLPLPVASRPASRWSSALGSAGTVGTVVSNTFLGW